MDEDRRDNNNERVVTEKEHSKMGPVLAVLAIAVLVLLAFLAFNAMNTEEVETPGVPDDVNVNVEESPGGTQ